METKQRFELREHSKQIEDLRAKRQTLGEDMYKHLESSELRFGKMELDAGELREDLSELEKGLQQYGQYKQTIADLAEGLTDGLTGYVEFAVQRT
jgi:chromosome segregation ATPase